MGAHEGVLFQQLCGAFALGQGFVACKVVPVVPIYCVNVSVKMDRPHRRVFRWL